VLTPSGLAAAEASPAFSILGGRGSSIAHLTASETSGEWRVAYCFFAALLPAFVEVRGAVPCFLYVVVSCHTDDRGVDDDKLLIVENVPLIAWLWEIAYQSFLVETTTMHAGLDMRSRSKIVREFSQKPSDVIYAHVVMGCQR
jgi:hypothetical protein